MKDGLLLSSLEIEKLAAKILEIRKETKEIKSGDKIQCPSCGTVNHFLKKASVNLCRSCGQSL